MQEVTEEKRVMGPEALLRDKVKQKRHREGYEDGLSTTHKAAAALAFVISDSPVEMLGQYTQLALEGPSSWKVRVEDTEKVIG
jgi:AdoMet-dependent rRNA methyltransferase SPB1